MHTKTETSPISPPSTLEKQKKQRTAETAQRQKKARNHPSSQYSGYSDFTASSEALKSGVTTACAEDQIWTFKVLVLVQREQWFRSRRSEVLIRGLLCQGVRNMSSCFGSEKHHLSQYITSEEPWQNSQNLSLQIHHHPRPPSSNPSVEPARHLEGHRVSKSEPSATTLTDTRTPILPCFLAESSNGEVLEIS